MTSDTIDTTATTNTGYKYISNTYRDRDNQYSYQVTVGRQRKEFVYNGIRKPITREQAFTKALNYRNKLLRF